MGGKAQSVGARVHRELSALINPEKAAFLPGFFKAVPGGYGEGDKFLGVVVPDIRRVAKRFRGMPLGDVAQLLDNPYHEMRMCGLLVLVDAFERGSEEHRVAIVEIYLRKLDRVNNWDLVDLSAPKILGPWLLERDRSPLYELARSGALWSERVAIISTLAFIRAGDFEDTEKLADLLLEHPHDLIHKAVGWMIREIGNRQPERLHRFLAPRYQRMPRTMLRYAIEKLPENERTDYLRGRVRAIG